jgi:2-polyprenyl-3-methyl-5-hydroxy-6-metoxy-1,4-benzoquinol methylase
VPNYDVDIDLANTNTSHAQVIDLVGGDKRVLDVGCWNGALGRVLMGFGCKVTGVELDEEAAAAAAAVLGDVKVADLDRTSLSDLFEAGAFDVVVFADVLEHLKDPRAALIDAIHLLAPDGRVVISVPNVAHGALRLALLQGQWRYTEKGLLDARHRHFHTRHALLELLSSVGLQAEDLRGTIADPLGVEVEIDEDRLPDGAVEWIRDQPDALVYQFQVAAAPVPDGREVVHTARLKPAANPDDVRLQDRHTDEAANAAREVLRMRDHVLGLQAEAVTAQARSKRENERKRNLRARLEKQNALLAQQRRRIAVLERQGFIGFLRRVKRRLAG